MKHLCLLGLPLALSVSCSQSVVSRSGVRIPASRSTTGLSTTMRRQVANAIDLGEGNSRLQQLRRQVTAEPANVELRREIAELYATSGYPEIAADHLRAALAVDNTRADLVVRYARLLRQLRLSGEARNVLLAYQKAMPDTSVSVLSWLAFLDDEAGEWKSAEKWYRNALALEPSSETLHNNLGFNLLQQTRTAEAIAEFEFVLKRNPASTIARNNLGLALASGLDGSKALEQWSAGQDPATAHSNLAALYLEQGKLPEARTELEAALKLSNQHPAALRNLQVLSELENTSLQLDFKPTPTRWDRIRARLIRALIGVPDPAKPQPQLDTIPPAPAVLASPLRPSHDPLQ